MLCFVMALKSKAVSKNWERVCELFENTLYSAYSQIDPDFRVIAVCHEIPALKREYDERVELLRVDFPPPDGSVPAETMKDKWKKIAVGLIHAAKYEPDFIMLMDADDLVSRRLSEYVNARKDCNGWIFEVGYKYRFGSQWILRNDRFNCGTNAIVSTKLIDFPADLSQASRQKCSILKFGHTIIKEKMLEAGTPLTPLPFPGAVYITGHGDNYTFGGQTIQWQGVRKFVETVRQLRLCTPAIRAEFSM